MPKSTNVHKSMLIKGVKMPTKALNQSDIESTRGRAARSGRNHGGAPLQGDGRGRNSFNYSSNQYQSGHNSQQSYGSRNNGYSNHQYSAPTSGWQPPPPGVGGFARGPPPPPPPGYGSYRPQNPPGYQQGYQQGGQGGYGPPPGYEGGNDRRRAGDRGGYSNNDGYRGGSNGYNGGGDNYRGGRH